MPPKGFEYVWIDPLDLNLLKVGSEFCVVGSVSNGTLENRGTLCFVCGVCLSAFLCLEAFGMVFSQDSASVSGPS